MSIDIEEVKLDLKCIFEAEMLVSQWSKDAINNGVKALEQLQAEIEQFKTKLMIKDQIIKIKNQEIEQLKKNQMPTELTAENGAKHLLSGEFYEEMELSCNHCDVTGYEPDIEEEQDCEVCKGDTFYTYKVPVSWTTIKDIYKKAANYFLPNPPEIKEQKS